MGNVFLTPPLHVRGKKRLCFLAYRDIAPGEVIEWNPLDYAGWLQGRLTEIVL